jgi:hypothetical protein
MKDSKQKIIERLHVNDPALKATMFRVKESNAKAFSMAIKNNTIIFHLSLNWNVALSKEMLELIADGLALNKSIKLLEFPAYMCKMELGNPDDEISGNAIGDKGVRYIVNALRKNKNIQQLNLSGTEMGVVGANYLAELLKVNTTLTYLDISQNPIGAKGLGAIEKALRNNKHLQSLSLSGTKGGLAGALVVADLLNHNVGLDVLTYAFNTIGHECAVLIAKALESNKTLKKLDLLKSTIASEDVGVITTSLEKNVTLHSMSFSTHEEWKEKELRDLCVALEKNVRLTRFDLFSYSNSPFKLPLTESISVVLNRNQLNRMKVMALLMKAYVDPAESQTPLKFLCKDVLMIIFCMVFPELTPPTFQKIKQSRFFTPTQDWGKESVMPEKLEQKIGRALG